MQRVIIVGSPRSGGRSAHLADALMEACIEECPDDGLTVFSVAAFDIDGCIGCDGCQPTGDEPPTEALPCVIDDDMATVRAAIDKADELIIVTPVYFSGVPSQLKAWLDRLQPYYWTDLRHGELRPATLHIVGEGADPFGFSGVLGAIASSILCAGFELDQAFSWVGRMTDDGEILDDAEVIAVSPMDDAS